MLPANMINKEGYPPRSWWFVPGLGSEVRAEVTPLIRTTDGYVPGTPRTITVYLNPGGDLGEKVNEYDWSSGWTTAAFYTVNGQTYGFFLKETDGTVHIRKMNPLGKLGVKVNEYGWSSGWTTATFYTVDGQTYGFFLKENDGTVHIHKMNP